MQISEQVDCGFSFAILGGTWRYVDSELSCHKESCALIQSTTIYYNLPL